MADGLEEDGGSGETGPAAGAGNDSGFEDSSEEADGGGESGTTDGVEDVERFQWDYELEGRTEMVLIGAPEDSSHAAESEDLLERYNSITYHQYCRSEGRIRTCR